MGRIGLPPVQRGAPAAPVNSADIKIRKALRQVNRLVLLRQRVIWVKIVVPSCGSLLCGIRGYLSFLLYLTKLRVEGTITRCSIWQSRRLDV